MGRGASELKTRPERFAMMLGRATRARKGNVDAASATASTETQSAACWGPSVTHLETRGSEEKLGMLPDLVYDEQSGWRGIPGLPGGSSTAS